jgi:hypothetical protein
MFKINADYTDYRNDNDPNMPGGAAVPTSNPQGFDGTPWRYLWFNHLHGFFQALFIKAFGSLDNINGQPDNAVESDGLKAIDRIIEKKFEDQYLIKTISGETPVIPLSEIPAFNTEAFDPDKKYVIFISPHGDYPEFLNFGAVLDEDGLHIYPRRIVEGKIIPGTRQKTWGEGVWGDGTWGGYGTMPINIIIKERE